MSSAPRILIGLHPYEPDDAEAIGFAETAEELGDVDAPIGLVDRLDFDVHARSEQPPLGAIKRHAMKRSERLDGTSPRHQRMT